MFVSGAYLTPSSSLGVPHNSSYNSSRDDESAGDNNPTNNSNTNSNTHQIKFQTSSSSNATNLNQVSSSKALYAHKLRSHTNKLRAQTNRIMSNLKGPALNCTPVRRYTGHKDGIWEVSVSRMGLPILGTASADHTAMIWGMHSGQALLQVIKDNVKKESQNGFQESRTYDRMTRKIVDP